jgi:hypothetical protein
MAVRAGKKDKPPKRKRCLLHRWHYRYGPVRTDSRPVPAWHQVLHPLPQDQGREAVGP